MPSKHYLDEIQCSGVQTSKHQAKTFLISDTAKFSQAVIDQTASRTDEELWRISPFNYSKSNAEHMEAVSRGRESEEEAGKEEKREKKMWGSPPDSIMFPCFVCRG